MPYDLVVQNIGSYNAKFVDEVWYSTQPLYLVTMFWKHESLEPRCGYRHKLRLFTELPGHVSHFWAAEVQSVDPVSTTSVVHLGSRTESEAVYESRNTPPVESRLLVQNVLHASWHV